MEAPREVRLGQPDLGEQKEKGRTEVVHMERNWEGQVFMFVA